MNLNFHKNRTIHKTVNVFIECERLENKYIYIYTSQLSKSIYIKSYKIKMIITLRNTYNYTNIHNVLYKSINI